MNKICSLLARQTLQSSVTRGSQFNSFNRIALYSTTSFSKLPPSKNPKHKTSVTITLISPENKIEITTLDNAKKMADRRQLKLVSIVDVDTKSSRPVYKLMTGSEFHAEEIKKREEKKEARKEQHIKPEKLLTLSNKISEHDLNSKMVKCVKWIEKLHEVRVVISGNESDLEKTEKIAAVIEEQMKPCEGRILQKRTKEGVIKFAIMPTIKKEKKEKDGPLHAPPVAPEKKLLDTENITPEVQQIRSHHKIAF